MSNLLPEHAEESVVRANLARLGVGVGFVLLAAAGAAALSLVPSYITLRAETNVLKASMLALKDPAGNDETGRDEIARARAEAASVASMGEAKVVPAIETIVEKRPQGVHIKTVVFVRGAQNTIVVSGIAPSREAIAAFRDALKNDPRFTSVSVPLDELAGGVDGSFHITLGGVF